MEAKRVVSMADAGCMPLSQTAEGVNKRSDNRHSEISPVFSRRQKAQVLRLNGQFTLTIVQVVLYLVSSKVK